MQFTLDHKVGTDYVTVTFKPHSVKGIALLNICDTYLRLGGEMIDTVSNWKFPPFITAQIIQEIIHNTCFVCGGLMKDSTAFLNDSVSFDDFGNDAGQQGTTQSRVGKAKQIKVRKCTSCGHSHT